MDITTTLVCPGWDNHPCCAEQPCSIACACTRDPAICRHQTLRRDHQLLRHALIFEARVEARDLSDSNLGLLLVRLRRDLANADDDELPPWLQRWWQIRLESAEREWQWRKRAEQRGGPTLQRQDFRTRLEVVKRSHDLVDLIERKVPLRRVGQEMQGLCPFHQDKHPSFSVNPEKQVFHCFGCGASGDLLTWVEMVETEDGTFGEALAWLEQHG